MPFATVEDLPQSMRVRLPPPAQEIYRCAFNSAYANFSDRPEPQREEIAHRVAWAAVKRRHRKQGER